MAESESAALPLGYAPADFVLDGRGTWTRTREMTGSKPVALPLGYTPKHRLTKRCRRDNGAHYRPETETVNNFFHSFLYRGCQKDITADKYRIYA